MANPKPKPKPSPTPVKKATTPSAKAAATAQAEANRQYAAKQTASRKTAAATQNLAFQRRANVSNNSRAPKPNPPARTKPGAGYQPPRSAAPAGKSYKYGNVAGMSAQSLSTAMGTGVDPKNPLKRILRGK